MASDADSLKVLVEDELARLEDVRVTVHIRSLLIEPTPVLRDWDYGEIGQQYVCWIVLEHPTSKTGIAYCESGFGPRSPWGLIGLDASHGLSMGMDAAWYTTFLQAYFESTAARFLPIWRVFKTDASETRLAVTPEGDWDGTWKRVMQLREEDSASRYECDTDIAFERE